MNNENCQKSVILNTNENQKRNMSLQQIKNIISIMFYRHSTSYRRKMKHSILALFFLLPLNALSSPDPFASSELTNVIVIKGTIAGVVWDFQNQAMSLGGGIPDPNPADNKFYSPTVLFFKSANGNIIKKMTFFSDDCPYSPVSLTATETTITMIAQILPIPTTNTSVGGSTPSSYSTCPHTDSITTLQEIRNLNTGMLIKRITLGNYRTAILQ